MSLLQGNTAELSKEFHLGFSLAIASIIPPPMPRRRRRRAIARLRRMQAELIQACDFVPGNSIFDIEPEGSEFPTPKTCDWCGECGHLMRNCFMPLKNKEQGDITIHAVAEQIISGRNS